MKKKSPFSDLVIGVGAVALGVAVVILASGLQKVKLGIGPGGFPRFIGVALILLGAVQLIKTLKNGVAAPAIEYRTEGWVTGLGVKIFTIAGPVIAYGLAASAVYGVILCLIG